MAEGIDVGQLGERLRRTRRKRGVTLKDVAEATEVSVATLSRIERGAAKDIESATLLALSSWMGTPLETLRDKPSPPPLPAGFRKRVEATPDVIELYLRADKNLDRRTATALSKMFRAAYEAFAKEQEGG